MKGEDEARRRQRPKEAVAEAESQEAGSSRHPHTHALHTPFERRERSPARAVRRHGTPTGPLFVLSLLSLSSLTTVDGESLVVDKDIAEATVSRSNSKLHKR
ncbi:hypothetical protein BHM03_00033923 [Ensete ventricosum]|nr:hypothetical protein BHM03_00033923 [Ensete ventricosum]